MWCWGHQMRWIWQYVMLWTSIVMDVARCEVGDIKFDRCGVVWCWEHQIWQMWRCVMLWTSNLTDMARREVVDIKCDKYGKEWCWEHQSGWVSQAVTPGIPVQSARGDTNWEGQLFLKWGDTTLGYHFGSTSFYSWSCTYTIDEAYSITLVLKYYFFRVCKAL